MELTEPRYPHVRVKLTGTDGNAVAVVGAVRKKLVRAGVPEEEVAAFLEEATAGDYDHLLETCFGWVEVS